MERFIWGTGSGAGLEVIMMSFSVSIRPKPRPTRVVSRVDPPANVTSGATGDGENGFGRDIVEDVGDNGVIVPSKPIILPNPKQIGLETVARLWNILIGDSTGELSWIPRRIRKPTRDYGALWGAA